MDFQESLVIVFLYWNSISFQCIMMRKSLNETIFQILHIRWWYVLCESMLIIIHEGKREYYVLGVFTVQFGLVLSKSSSDPNNISYSGLD